MASEDHLQWVRLGAVRPPPEDSAAPGTKFPGISSRLRQFRYATPKLDPTECENPASGIVELVVRKWRETRLSRPHNSEFGLSPAGCGRDPGRRPSASSA